jgi:sugar transferase (PEP-CTERM/EpsH1 system associated)
MPADSRPVVVHVMYRFDTGGLENGVVNLINHMPANVYRHVILALTDVTEFKQRIRRDDVEFIALQKPPGHSIWQFPKLYRLFKRLRPAIVHSRNLAALEAQIPAWAAGVPVRIHGEHGRDVGDLDGNNRTYQRLRRLHRPFVHHYVALSRDLADYLMHKVHVSRDRITQAYNGVDVSRFSPVGASAQQVAGCPFNTSEHFVVGTVGRMQTVKDQTLLARAFVMALQTAPDLKARLRLVMVGDGPLRAEAQAILDAAGVAHLAWLPGARDDVAAVMQGFSCFVLPSLAEGISNTILEAMASGLPVIATGVGGNADLVADGETGQIVPAADPQTMAQSLIEFASSAAQSRAMGLAGRERVVQRFSMQAMVNTYQRVYDEQLRRRRGP